MRRIVLSLLALAAAAALVWVLADGAGRDDAPRAAHEEEEDPLPSLRGRTKETSLLPDPSDDTAVHPGGTLTLEGRVERADGRAWRGAVHAVWSRRTPLWDVVAGRSASVDVAPSGTFVLEDLPVGPVRIVAERKDGFCAESPEVRLPRAEPYVFVVPGGEEIEGRVVDAETDEPVAGAVLRTYRRGSRQGTVAATSDDGGSFTWPRDVLSGEVAADGYATRTFSCREDEEALVIPLWREGLVRGRVLAASDGAPVPGVTVYAARPNPDNGVWMTTSRADGAFEVPVAAAETLRLYAIGAGWIGADLRSRAGADPAPPVIVAVEPGQVVERDLRVAHGVRVVGRVVDAEGAPVEGAAVDVDLDYAGLGWTIPEILRAVTDADGHFVFDALPPVPNAIFYARAPGHALVRTDPVALRPGSMPEIEIRLPAGARAIVIVRAGDTGGPIEGTRVEVTSLPAAGESWTATGITDSEGRYILEGPAPGRLRLSVRAEGYVWRRETVEMPASDTEIEVTLPRAALIEGRVVLPDGVSASRISGWVRPADAPGWKNHSQSLRLAMDGAFRVEVPPVGTWTVSAQTRWGREHWEGETTVLAGTRGVELVLEVKSADVRPLPELAGEIEVRVVGPDGVPVREAVVAFSQWYPEGSTGYNDRTVEGCATFRLQARATAVGILVHSARGQGGKRLGPKVLALGDPAPGTVEVPLPLAGQMTGRVVGPEGKGVPSVEVRATPLPPVGWSEDHAIHAITTTRSDADGHWRLRGLGDDRYELDVVPPPGWLRPDAGAHAGLRAGDDDVVVRLARGVSVVITVVAPDGAPLPGAWVYVHRSRGRKGIDELEGSWVVLTDPTGRARLVGLDPLGRYGVNIEAPSGPAYEDAKTVSLEAWIPQDETVRLVDGYRIPGVARDSTGRGLPGVYLWWRQPDGTWETTRSFGDGRFAVGPAPTPSLDVRLATTHVAAEAREALPAATIRAAEENVLVVEPGYVLEMRSEDWRGRARVTRLTEPRRASRHYGDGELVLVGLYADAEYAIQLGPMPDGRVGYWRGRPPASGRLEIPLVAGKTVEGSIHLPTDKDIWNLRVHILDEGLRLEGVFLPGPRYVIRGVPEGRWEVEVQMSLGGQTVSRPATVEAGGRADFDFTRGE